MPHDHPITRLPRLVIPGLPYHVTQRGNRRGWTFFEDADHALYRDLLAQTGRPLKPQKRGPKPKH